MAHHRPAEYVDAAELFYPPQRTLGFNPQLRLNDSLLAQSYVEAYDISYPEAVKRIESDIAEIKQTIAIEGAYEFHGIGTVKRNPDGVYDFEPCTAGLLTPDLYALNSFSIDILADNKKPAEEEQYSPKANGYKAIMRKSLSGNAVRNIVAAAMILLLFIFSSIPAGLGSNKVMTCSVLDTEFITTFLKDNTPFINNKALPTSVSMTQETAKAQYATATTVKSPVASPDTTSAAMATAKQPARTEQKGYVIVLASKVSKQGAETFIAQLGKAGFNDARLLERGSMRKVVYGNYPTEASAYSALNALRDESTAFAEAWVSK